MTISRDDWLSEVMGREVYNVGVNTPLDRFGLIALLDFPADMICIKTDDITLVNPLIRHDFNLITTEAVFSGVGVLCSLSTNNFRIDNYKNMVGYEDDILKIAESSFLYSRFHNDRNIDIWVANKIKRKWVENALDGNRGDHVFIIRDNVRDKAVGFMIVIVDRLKLVVDLIGVDNTYKRAGIGSMLMNRFVSLFRDGISLREAGTQLDNIGAIKLYKKFGLTDMSKPKYVLHWHKE